MKNLPLYEVRQISDLKEMLNSSCELYAERAAFFVKNSPGEDYTPITYTKLMDDVNALGTAFLDLGLKGKRIALISESRYEWAVSYLAALNGTGIVIPLDKELPSHEIKSLLLRSKADAVVFSNKIADNIMSIAPHLESVSFYINMDDSSQYNNALSFSSLAEKGYKLVSSGDRSYIDAEIDSEAMSILLFTSATTDVSKAVMLSHKNICTNLMSMSSMLYIDPTDTFLSVLPIHHTYECTCGFLCPLYRGASIAYCEGLRHIQRNLVESKATVMLAVPLIFEAIYGRIWDQASKDPKTLKKLKFGLGLSGFLKKFNIDITRKLFSPIHKNLGPNIRIFISGAAGIDSVVSKGFRNLGISIVQGYGLTECSPIVALNRDVDFKDDAAGLPLPNLKVEIQDANPEGIGEIVVNGPSVMIGYYENDQATANAFKDGYFHTGDLGFIDNDGFVHITGRKKNVIVTKNGKNIYPEEIETLLNRSAFIKEALVYGKEDSASGDTLVAATIVPDMDKIQETSQGNPLNTAGVLELIKSEVKAVNKNLVIYKHIKDIQLRENEFAKTTTRKIKRYMENLG